MAGKIYKARIIGPSTPDEIEKAEESKQLTEDPFSGMVGYESQIRKPPYSFEQLVLLAEAHPVHGAALEQKAVDVVGSGPVLVPRDVDAPEAQKFEIEEWLEGLTEQATITELLNTMWLDHDTVGWGMLEVSRDPQQKARKLFHVPAQTVRAHSDKKRLVQIRQGRQAWFKRWGIGLEEVPMLLSTGRKAPDNTGEEKLANEALLFVRPSRRSTWYGIPGYVSAIGHLTLAVEARDYNIQFFANSREPRLIFIVSGTDEESLDDTLDELEQSLRTQHGQAHRNLLLPLTGDATVKIERITAIQNDLHFTKLMEVTERNILIAHRMPPDRIGAVMRGMLGGNATQNINRVYKSAVVAPAQAMLLDRLNRFMWIEFARFKGAKNPKSVQWKFALEDLDLSDEQLDVQIVVTKVKHNLVTLNEGRELLGMERKEEFGELTLAEFLSQNAPQASAAMAKLLADEQDMLATGRSLAAIVERMDQIDEQLEELLLTGESAKLSDGSEEGA